MYIEKIINVTTNEEVIREYTAEEIAEAKKGEKEAKDRVAKSLEAQNLRQSALAKLLALGLTEEEIAAL